MKKKMLIFFIVLLFTVGIACAGNNTTEDMEVDDGGDYILPISITNNGIEFSDGFTGFSLDLSQNSISTSDKFVVGSFSGDELENNIKLAIIECYKQGKEDAMGAIISEVDDKDSNNDVLQEVFKSQEQIGDTAVVNIDNTTEATFTFEFLKSSDDSTPNCVAYTVSFKTVEAPASDDTSDDNSNDNNESGPADTDDKKTDDNKKSTNDDNDKKTSKNDKKTDDNKKSATANDDKKNDNDDVLTAEDNKNDTDKKTDDDSKNKTSDDNGTTTTETNKTIVNKTNTVIVNETNTTIVNKNNVNTINETNDTPENDTVSNVLNTAGNPIFLLIVVIVIIAIAAVVMRRKD
jgi:hypothetical protein